MIRKHKIGAFLIGLALSVAAYAGLETVTHIQDLNASWPLGSDLASTSDDHIRNIKSALKTDFPNFNGTYTSAALPVFAIPSDTNTGMYSVGADDLGFTTGGTLRFDISTSAFTGTLPWRGQDGTVGAPALSFSGDTDTGIYRVGANDFALVAGGGIATEITSSTVQIATGKVLTIPDGTVSAPAFAYGADTDTGLFRTTSNTISFATGGSTAAELALIGAGSVRLRLFGGDGTSASNALLVRNTGDTTNLFAVRGDGQGEFSDGLVGTPGISFLNDPDTGLYRATNNELRISAGGTTISLFSSAGLSMNGQQVLASDGTAAAPGYSFSSDTDTGFYRDTANQIGIALAGSTAGQIAQGSYTGTLTGCTTSPTATITYQRIGNLVMLNIPALTATSNATSFTITGAPAVIRPAATTGVKNISRTVDSGTNLFSSEVDMNSSGTLTFYAGGSATGWTAAGTKGVPVASQVWLLLN